MVKKPAKEFPPSVYAGANPTGASPRGGGGLKYNMSGFPTASTQTPGESHVGGSPLIGMDQYIANLNSRSPQNVTNQAAMRAYTRNAPYMENLIGDPRAMLSEMKSLQMGLAQNPNDPVSEYRLRILRQAMGDVYGIQPNEFLGYFDRPSYPTTPQTRGWD